MGELRSQDKRDKLRLFKAAALGPPALLTVLNSALTAADAAVSNGALLQSTSEAGGSVSFQFLSEYSPVTARRLVGELLDLYDKAVIQLVADGIATPNDSQIYTLMMGSLKPIRRFRTDFSAIRYGTGLQDA